MRYRDLYDQDYEPEPVHPAKQTRPRDIASLFVMGNELADLRNIAVPLGGTMIGVKQITLTPSFEVEVLCESSDAKLTLEDAWATYCETSSHRPHSKEEALAWAERHGRPVNIPRDWTF